MIDVYKRQEYDSTRAFERAGAKVITQVFSNLSAEDIREMCIRDRVFLFHSAGYIETAGMSEICGMELCAPRSVERGRGSSGAVSSTHLDVYKRQAC